MKKTIQVISQGGRLVGVYVPPEFPPTDPNSPNAKLVAGPKQKLYEVAVEVTEASFRTAKHIEEFHAAVRKRLKLRK